VGRTFRCGRPGAPWQPEAAAINDIVFRNCNLLDGTGAEPSAGATVVVEAGRIAAIDYGSESKLPDAAIVIDCSGRTLMPGLTDAHIHAAIIDTNFVSARRESPATVAFRIREVLEQTLQAGFTTVRDAFGIDWGIAQACERGYINGPRILFTGACLSQTGGHGDWREPSMQMQPLDPLYGLVATPRICDSPDEMRRAAREMLRMGAHGIKLMAGGGCMSPTDQIEHTQFTIEEMAAACYEARTVGKIALVPVRAELVEAQARGLPGVPFDKLRAGPSTGSGQTVIPVSQVKPDRFVHRMEPLAWVDHAAQARAPQPMRKATPPMGVIAPSQRWPVSVRM